ncbi:NAD-dependent epimerase/dehydratase family protein [bacterium]|nr:NAD-dependent epimerase/dehydratase family protein [bacterium]
MNLVTGGCGFIGSHLVELLLARGLPVRVFDKSDPMTSWNGEVEYIHGDIRDRDAVRLAVANCEHVWHLAANPNLWTRRRSDFDQVNHVGTIHVLEEALRAGAQRVVHTSTESILTSKRFQGGRVEDLRPKREDMVGPYCRSKFDAEAFAFQLADAGHPILVASPTLPIGPGDRGISPPTRMSLACARGELPAYLDCRFNMMDVRDIALGLVRVLERGIPGRRYLLGAWNVELKDWLDLVASKMGRKAPSFRVPYALAWLAGIFSECWADYVSGKMPQATVTGVRLTRYTMHFDPSRSLAELGIDPRPLEESLDDFLQDAFDKGWILKPASG